MVFTLLTLTFNFNSVNNEISFGNKVIDLFFLGINSWDCRQENIVTGVPG